MTEDKKITWSMGRLREAASSARGQRAAAEPRREPGFGEGAFDDSAQREPGFDGARFGASRWDEPQRQSSSSDRMAAAADDRLARTSASPAASRFAFQGAPFMHTVILLVGVPAVVLATTLASLMMAPSRADIPTMTPAALGENSEASREGGGAGGLMLPYGAMEAEAERSTTRGLGAFPPAFSGNAAPAPKASGSFLFLGLRDMSPVRGAEHEPTFPRLKSTPARLEIPLSPDDEGRYETADSGDIASDATYVDAPAVDADAPSRPRAPVGDPLRGTPAFTSLENGFLAVYGTLQAPGVFGAATTHGHGGVAASVKDAASALERAPDEEPEAPSMSEPPSARLLAATQKDIGSLTDIDRTPDKAPPPEKKRATAPPKFDGRSAEQILKAALSAEASEVGVLQEDFGAAMEASLAAALRPEAVSELAAAPSGDDTGKIDQSPDQPPAGDADVASLQGAVDAEQAPGESDGSAVSWAPEFALRPSQRPARSAPVIAVAVAVTEVDAGSGADDIDGQSNAAAASDAPSEDAEIATAFAPPEPGEPTTVAPEFALKPRLRP